MTPATNVSASTIPKQSRLRQSNCANLISAKTILDDNDAPPEPDSIANAAEKEGSLSLSVLFDVDSCAPGTSVEDQKLDFTQMSQEQCEQDMFTAISAECECYTYAPLYFHNLAYILKA